MWRHTRRGDQFVTVIIDLTPIGDGTGLARLLDMVAQCRALSVDVEARRDLLGHLRRFVPKP